MAVITINRNGLFPVGTVVGLYPAASLLGGSGQARPPGAAALAPTTAAGTATTAVSSNQLTAVTTSSGTFQNGMVVSGAGIPANTRILSGAGTATMTISQNATAAAVGVAISATGGTVADDGSLSFFNVVAETPYVAYANVGGNHRSLWVRSSDAVTSQGAATGTGTTTSGSPSVTGVATLTGTFQVGQRILGAGIPPDTFVKAIVGSTITLGDGFGASRNATASASGVALTAIAAYAWRARVRRRLAAIGA